MVIQVATFTDAAGTGRVKKGSPWNTGL